MSKAFSIAVECLINLFLVPPLYLLIRLKNTKRFVKSTILLIAFFIVVVLITFEFIQLSIFMGGQISSACIDGRRF